eukprot:10188820-Ditylum_brightwellii.AAC.1
MMPPTKRNKKKFHGSTSMNLMFVLDEWTDSMGKSRISVQLHVPSGGDSTSKMDVRVPTDQRSLLVVFPMLPFLCFEEPCQDSSKDQVDSNPEGTCDHQAVPVHPVLSVC